MTIKPFKGVRVAVPAGVAFETAEGFARSKAHWLQVNMERVCKMEQTATAVKAQSHLDRKAAREKLVRRLNELSARHGLCYARVFVKNQKTRWGSCSEKNNINLNVNLAHLPEELMDYAILHELVHTRIKNHGKRFWELLLSYMPDAKRRDRALNDYQAILAGADRC